MDNLKIFKPYGKFNLKTRDILKEATCAHDEYTFDDTLPFRHS